MIGQLQINPMGRLRKTQQNTLFEVILGDEGAEAFILQLTGLIGRGLLLEVLIPWHFWPPLMGSRADFQDFIGEHLWQRDMHTGVGGPQEHTEGTGSRDVSRAQRASASHARFGCEIFGWTWNLWNLKPKLCCLSWSPSSGVLSPVSCFFIKS